MAVDTNQVIRHLSQLFHLDVDAVHAYQQAIADMENDAIRQRMIEFQQDHERHIHDLSAEILRLGGEPPKRSRDLKGFFLEGFTAIRSATGTEGALKAMRSNERLTNRRHQEALESPLPAETLAVVHKCVEDEARHLAYIEEALRAKRWERPAAPLG